MKKTPKKDYTVKMRLAKNPLAFANAYDLYKVSKCTAPTPSHKAPTKGVRKPMTIKARIPMRNVLTPTPSAIYPVGMVAHKPTTTTKAKDTSKPNGKPVKTENILFAEALRKAHEHDVDGLDVVAMVKCADRDAWAEWVKDNPTKAHLINDVDKLVHGYAKSTREKISKGLKSYIDTNGHEVFKADDRLIMPIFTPRTQEYNDYVNYVWSEIFMILLEDETNTDGAYEVIHQYIKDVRHAQPNTALVSYEWDVIKHDEEGNIIGELDTRPLAIVNVRKELHDLELWNDMVDYLEDNGISKRAIVEFEMYVNGRTRETIARRFKCDKSTVSRNLKRCIEALEEYANNNNLSVLTYMDKVGKFDKRNISDVAIETCKGVYTKTEEERANFYNVFMESRIKEYENNKRKSINDSKNGLTPTSKKGYFKDRYDNK